TGGVAEAVAALRGTGYAVCVVHGAGPQISEEMARRGLDIQFIGGRRVTTAEGLEVVRESLTAVNAAVCDAIGADAVGLAGAARIHFLTDVAGVFHDGWLVRAISAGRAETLVGDGTFEGGIVPKLLAAARAAQSGLVAEIGSTAVVA